MNLQAWTQVAQILGPVVAAVAAAFSAVSSRAAMRAARTARDSRARSDIAESRGRRAHLDVEIESGSSPWPVVLLVTNKDRAHSARGFRIRLPGHEPANSEIVPNASLRVETNITGPQLSAGDFYPGLPEHMRPEEVTAHAAVLKGELDYRDDLEIKCWRFGVHIVETVTQTPRGLSYAYGALLFGAPQLIEDTMVEPPGARKRIGLAWQVFRGRRRVADE